MGRSFEAVKLPDTIKGAKARRTTQRARYLSCIIDRFCDVNVISLEIRTPGRYRRPGRIFGAPIFRRNIFRCPIFCFARLLTLDAGDGGSARAPYTYAIGATKLTRYYAIAPLSPSSGYPPAGTYRR